MSCIVVRFIKDFEVMSFKKAGSVATLIIKGDSVSTAAKMNTLFEANGISTLKLLYNNAYRLDDCIICGTRGWFTDKIQQHTVGTVDYGTIINRECMRLKMSLDEAERLKGDSSLPILVFLHFPPIWRDFECKEILDILNERNIKKCFFGHIHGTYSVPQRFKHDGIEMILTSADFLNFSPIVSILVSFKTKISLYCD